MDPFFDHFLKHVRGLGFAVSVFTMLVLEKEDPLNQAWMTVLTWFGMFCAYRLSGKLLDKRIYDFLFGTDGKFRGLLDCIREKAKATFVKLRWNGVGLNSPFDGLQEASLMAFEHSDAWERRVELWLELSKAARTLVLPLVFLWFVDAAGFQLLPDRIPKESWLRNSSAVGWSLLAALVLYVSLRVMHNWALYRLVADAKVAQGMMKIETLRTKPEKDRPDKPIYAYNFYCWQVPEGVDPDAAAAVAAVRLG